MTTATPSAGPRPSAAPRVAALVASLVLPIVIAAVGVIVCLLALPSAPATVITNWGLGGGGSTGPAWIFPVILGAVGLGIPLLLALTGVRGRRVTDTTAVLSGVSLGAVALVTVMGAGSLLIQSGPDAVAGADPGALLAAAFATGAGLFAACWFLLPRDPAAADTSRRVDPIARPAGAITAWSVTARSGRALLVGVGLGILVSAAAAAVVIVAAGAAWWPIALLPVLLTVLFSAFAVWRVSAGVAGLVVRSVVGLPVFRVAASDIAEVRVVDVDPVGDFGGWGVRVGLPGGGRRLGVVLRAGEAIEVQRCDGRRLVVTVDDAATGAAVLAAAAQDAGAPAPR